MDTYEEVLRQRRVISYARGQILTTEEPFPGSLDPGHDDRGFWLTQVQLEMFGSAAVQAVSTLSFAALNHWLRAYNEWRDLTQAGANDEETKRKWQQVQSSAEAATLADLRLIEVIKAEVNFKEPIGREKWHRVIALREARANEKLPE